MSTPELLLSFLLDRLQNCLMHGMLLSDMAEIPRLILPGDILKAASIFSAGTPYPSMIVTREELLDRCAKLPAVTAIFMERNDPSTGLFKMSDHVFIDLTQYSGSSQTYIRQGGRYIRQILEQQSRLNRMYGGYESFLTYANPLEVSILLKGLAEKIGSNSAAVLVARNNLLNSFYLE